MAGVKGKSGGARAGSGRKPDILKFGKSFLFWETTNNGRTPLEVVEVTKYDHTTGQIELTNTETGTVYHLSSGKRKRR